MIHTYKSSQKVIRGSAVLFGLVLVAVGILVAISNPSINSVVEAVGLFLLIFIIILFGVSLSKIEVDTDHNNISYRNNYKRYKPVPIDNIIQIAYPRQNYIARSLNPFIYVWYDDPERPGTDRYLKIADTQFDAAVLTEIVKQLKALNPRIKLDAGAENLLKKLAS
jgi:ABC-type transport system involved in multi-copper enzyme maturation permease subunit